MRKLVVLLVVIVAISILSCDTGRVYDQTYTIHDQSWHKDSILFFNVNINDTVSLHKFFLNIRHNTDYPYSNIYFFLYSEFPNENTARDTIECILADINGEWLGRGSGKLRDNSILLKNNIRFPMEGTYTFGVQHGMRVEKLTGIEDIGIRVEK